MTDSTYKSVSVSTVAQPWLASPVWDGCLIIMPAFLSSIIALTCGNLFNRDSTLPLWAWVVLILLIDVAHVYATLFRTYLDPDAFSKNKTLLIAAPLICWLVGCLLYSIDYMIFWRTLAYLAVFHFVRQQFGFMTLYSRKDPPTYKRYRLLDAIAIYTATGFPLLYWHMHLPRNFDWFVQGDFFQIDTAMAQIIMCAGAVCYAAIATAYLAKELILSRSTNFINIPKNLIIIGTALSWWVGIVSFNSDLVFTMTNVVSHGIPYIGLVWLYHSKGSRQHSVSSTQRTDGDLRDCASTHGALAGGCSQATELKFAEPEPGTIGTRHVAHTHQSNSDWTSKMISLLLTYAPLFIGFLWLLAYVEEGLWDGFVWREHLSFFSLFTQLPAVSDPSILAILIPLLSLPQSTHYVLDGFIWRIKDRNSVWSA